MREERRPYLEGTEAMRARRAQQARRTAKRAKRARRRAAGCLVLAALCAAGLLCAARWAGGGGPQRLLAALEAAGGSSLPGAHAPRESENAPAGEDGDSASGAPAGEDGGLLFGIRSAAAVLMELDGGQTLAAQSEDEPLPPASLTKLMTVFAALELGLDPGRTVTLDASLFPPLWEENASMAGLLPGETATVAELLYGALLPSGAECSVTLACCAAGDEQTFVQRMNQRAAALGMQDTHFCNATGLQDPAHVSTVRDIALLLDAALDNETFRQVFTARQYTTAATDAHPDGILLQSSMFAALDGESTGRAVLLGGKTGYTSEAGQCLASLAELDRQEYILVTAGAPGDHSTAPLHVQDAVTVYTRLSDACGG